MMKIRNFLLVLLLLIPGLNSGAFRLEYPGEDGFFIGKPMVYAITAGVPMEDPNEPFPEGIFTFGPGKVTIDGIEYYDCVYKSASSESHFYMAIDKNNRSILLRRVSFGQDTELEISPPINNIKYPVFSGAKWSDTTNLSAKNLTIPGTQIKFPALKINNVQAETVVSQQVITVPAGTYGTLLVETTYIGTLIGLRMSLIQRTWLNPDNAVIKRNFEFILYDTAGKPVSKIMLYQLELSRSNPDPHDLNWDGMVNVLDLIYVSKFIGKPLQRLLVPNPDVDGSGSVDLQDMIAVLRRFGRARG